MHINEKDFNHMGSILIKVLKDLGVNSAYLNEIGQIWDSMKIDIVDPRTR